MQGSLLTLANLSIFWKVWTCSMYLGSCILLFICSLSKCIQRKCWHTMLPPSRQQKLQLAGNLTEEKSDTCADLWFLLLVCLSFLQMSLLQILINTVIFCILTMVSEVWLITIAFMFSASSFTLIG